jgi:MYXO-CTERM domain-containing protein
MRAWAACAVGAPLLLLGASPVHAEDFTYAPPGVLESPADGREDTQVYVPGMRFPIEESPAYANSQVYGVGGMHGPSGSQCDERNYGMPWYDNYCEPRAWAMPMCPSGSGHQGQDIRPGTCEDLTHKAVAAEAGTVTFIGSYSLTVTTPDGTLHRYLHMDPPSLLVETGHDVTWGQPLGFVSDAFGDASTTIHLHYDIRQNVLDLGVAFVPTYMSLVRSYETLLGVSGATCEDVPPAGATLTDASPCFRLHGPPQFWRYVDDAGYGGTLRWTRGFISETPSNWAEWQLSFEAAGAYEVAIHNVPEYGSSRMAPWAVFAGGTRHDVVVDLEGREGWISLGVYTFAEGGGQGVAVFDNSGEDTALDRRIPADAIRLVPDPPSGAADAGSLTDAQVPGDATPGGDAGRDAQLAADAEPVAPPPADGGCGCVVPAAGPAPGMIPALLVALSILLTLADRRRRH